MAAPAEFAYAQARLQARHGAAPAEAWWHTLEASRTGAHYLGLARSGPYAAWTDGLDATADVQRIEMHLRTRWRHDVDEVARWLPPRWQPAVREFGALPELALRDPPPGRSDALRWLAGWQRLWPPDAGDATLLQRPARLLLPRLGDASALRGTGASAERQALLRLFRRHAMSAVAAFAHLALLALELERVRGGAVVRTLFEHQCERAAESA